MSAPTSTAAGRHGPGRLAVRALVVPLAVLLVVTAYLVTARALAVREATAQLNESARPAVEQPWRSSYGRRFPGCVPAVLWPQDEAPVALVVRWPGGDVERVERRTPLRHALAGGHTDGRVIGVCYR